jgi:hypothetical protein
MDHDDIWAETSTDLKASLQQLSLTCRAMWELLSERTSIAQADLLAKVREIDLRDGVRDGRATAPPQECPKCSRMNAARAARCIYCATELPGAAPARPA